jgi:hypothetical protein
MAFAIWRRPYYAYGVYNAANLAKQLGFQEVTVIEFGVAGGNGLLEMERLAAIMGPRFDVQVNVIGFDNGTGLPAPTDYRDLPHIWEEGSFSMDEAALREKLEVAKLILGDVSETVPRFLRQEHPSPIGFIAFDLDYYSSTKAAFQIFEGREETRLPRVFCYFDDIIFPERACHNEYTGELCAIREFNVCHESKKICPMPRLVCAREHAEPWNDQIYVFHDFYHPLYTVNVTPAGASHRSCQLAQ